jgi:hypothetical protein
MKKIIKEVNNEQTNEALELIKNSKLCTEYGCNAEAVEKEVKKHGEPIKLNVIQVSGMKDEGNDPDPCFDFVKELLEKNGFEIRASQWRNIYREDVPWRCLMLVDKSPVTEEKQMITEREWGLTIDLSDVWPQEDEFVFEEVRDAIVNKLEQCEDDVLAFSEDIVMEYEDLISQLKYAEDEDEFDYTLEELYNWADDNNVFIEKFGG